MGEMGGGDQGVEGLEVAHDVVEAGRVVVRVVGRVQRRHQDQNLLRVATSIRIYDDLTSKP